MVLYEDNYIIAVNKPNNVLVHHSKMANNARDEKTLVQLVLELTGKKYYPIHRLDRKTSGIVLFAKDKKDVAIFQNLFLNNEIQKTYYGIVRGFTPTALTIDTDVKGRDSEVYKTALTHLNTLKNKELAIPVQPYEQSRYSLVKLSPKTGRLHQLRIHMNKINHPLIGDPKYGDRFHNRMFIKEFNRDKLFLHAKAIEFKHPFTNEEIHIQAKYPSDWQKIFAIFGW